MPAESKAQMKYLAIHHPEVLDKWKKEGKLYDKGKDYKDLPDKKGEKTAFDLIEADPAHGVYDEKKTKTEVSYRKGQPGKGCSFCISFRNGYCEKVEGSIKSEGLCDLFEENEQKTASLMRIYRRNQGTALRKVAQGGGGSAGSNMAALLDKQIEENKELRTQLIAMEAGSASGGPMGPPPAGAPGMPPGPQAMPPDPSMMGGMPPDPSMGGAPPPDPSMAGMPPMDPNMDPNMDPSMMGGMPPMPPPPDPQVGALKMELDDAQMAMDALKKEKKELKDENRALHLAVGDSANIEGPSKNLYDRAGSELDHVQKIPNEGVNDVMVPQEDIQEILAKLQDALSEQGGGTQDPGMLNMPGGMPPDPMGGGMPPGMPPMGI